jgi:hypothetical protein
MPPDVLVGTVKFAVNPPVVLDVTLAGMVVSLAPLYVKLIVCDAIKRAPDEIFIELPGRPLLGDSVIVGVATVNDVAPTLVPSVALTVFAPVVDAGTINVVELNCPR